MVPLVMQLALLSQALALQKTSLAAPQLHLALTVTLQLSLLAMPPQLLPALMSGLQSSLAALPPSLAAFPLSPATPYGPPSALLALLALMALLTLLTRLAHLPWLSQRARQGQAVGRQQAVQPSLSPLRCLTATRRMCLRRQPPPAGLDAHRVKQKQIRSSDAHRKPDCA